MGKLESYLKDEEALREKKNNIIDKSIFGGYFVLMFGWCLLYGYNLVSEYLDNKKAVMHIEAPENGDFLRYKSDYYAFDRNSDGIIDEIKVHGTSILPSRTPAAYPFNSIYKRGYPEFEDYLKYFEK